MNAAVWESNKTGIEWDSYILKKKKKKVFFFFFFATLLDAILDFSANVCRQFQKLQTLPNITYRGGGVLGGGEVW